MSLPSQRIPELEAQISDLRESLGALEAELKKERAQAQQESIENLSAYMDAVDTKFSSLRTFWRALLEDLRKD